MIFGYFHEGSGLGNQLHRYVFVRTKAKELGVPFGMIGNFKGEGIIDIDKGEPIPKDLSDFKTFNEEKIVMNGIDIRGYDPKTEQIKDNTIVDGEFQDEKYFNIDDVRGWLKVINPKPYAMHFTNHNEVCLLNVRGGEYKGVTELFLPKEYWYQAMENMRKIKPNMKFAIVTDDIELCQEWFPNFYIKHDDDDWSNLQEAKYLILSNSSFAIFPALTGKAEYIIAPLHWARHNIEVWATNQNRYKKFHYQGKSGNIVDEIHL